MIKKNRGHITAKVHVFIKVLLTFNLTDKQQKDGMPLYRPFHGLRPALARLRRDRTPRFRSSGAPGRSSRKIAGNRLRGGLQRADQDLRGDRGAA